MICDSCGANNSEVVDSRYLDSGNQKRRRRQCISCGERFTTYEVSEVEYDRFTLWAKEQGALLEQAKRMVEMAEKLI